MSDDAPTYYQFPDLSRGYVQSRLKRIERTVQFQQRGMIGTTNAKYRTVAADQVDRDGKIIASTLTGTVKASQLGTIKRPGVVQQAAVRNLNTSGTGVPTLATVLPGQTTTYVDQSSGTVYVATNVRGVLTYSPL